MYYYRESSNISLSHFKKQIMKSYGMVLALLILSVFVYAQESTQKSKKERKAEKLATQIEKTKSLINGKNFVFIPDRVNPSSGRSVSVNGFHLKLEGENVICYLPFYGRAYSAEYGSGSSPFDFTQKLEKYSMTVDKKGFNIKFSVKNKSDNIDFILNVFESGSASLRVNSTNRATISYDGDIVEIKE